MIPKIIHYIWVGDKPKSDIVNKCIESWKKYCPDYKIIEWNNNSLKEINNRYVTEAFNCKKWAFVSDYLRLYALKKFGGVYCDTDLEITNPIDKFLENNFFTGYEYYKNNFGPVTAIMGANQNNSIISDLLAEYDDIHFIINNNMDMTTNTTRVSRYFFEKFKLKSPYNGNQITKLEDQGNIYPYNYFCTYEYGKENYSIHHFNGSWMESYTRKNKLSFGKYSLVRIIKNEIDTILPLPLAKDEKIIFTLSNNSNRQLYIIKKVYE